MQLSSGQCFDAHPHLNEKFPDDHNGVDNKVTSSVSLSSENDNQSNFLVSKPELSERSFILPSVQSRNHASPTDPNKNNNVLNLSNYHDDSKHNTPLKNEEDPSNKVEYVQTVVKSSNTNFTSTIREVPCMHSSHCASDEVQSSSTTASSTNKTKRLSVPIHVKSNFSVCPELISKTQPAEQLQQFRFQVGVTTSHIQATLQAMCGTENTATSNRFVLVIMNPWIHVSTLSDQSALTFIFQAQFPRAQFFSIRTIAPLVPAAAA